MNGPFIVAQANTAGTVQDAQKKPVKVVKVTKPSDGQAITVELGHDQQIKVDLTAIAGENFTLARIGEKLIFLFDNRSTVTIESYFDSMNVASPNVTFEVSPGRVVGATEFATLFSITTDQSVLPAARSLARRPRQHPARTLATHPSSRWTPQIGRRPPVRCRCSPRNSCPMGIPISPSRRCCWTRPSTWAARAPTRAASTRENPTVIGRHRRRRAERRRHQLGGHLRVQRGAGRQLHRVRHPGLGRPHARCRLADHGRRHALHGDGHRGRRLHRHRLGLGGGGQLHRRGRSTRAARAPTPSRSTPQNPTVTVDIVDGALSDGDTSSVVTFTFSEAPVAASPSRHPGLGRPHARSPAR